jgi:hypothetical protein
MFRYHFNRKYDGNIIEKGSRDYIAPRKTIYYSIPIPNIRA